MRLYPADTNQKSEPHHRVIRFGFMLPTPEVWVPTLSAGEVDKNKSEPHHRVIRFGFMLPTPEVWVPTLSAGEPMRG